MADPRSISYTTGGTVQAGNGIYLPRSADAELLQACQQGIFAYVLAPRQIGKSSLMTRTAEDLRSQSIQAVVIDLQAIGVNVTAEQWYLGLLVAIEDQLLLDTDVIAWWQEHPHLGFTQRLTQFFAQVLLQKVDDRLVILVDEIDTVLSLDFTDDFLVAIRYFQVNRAQNPAFERLSFVLLGVATPGDLIRDPQRTPFNIGKRIEVTDFTLAEARPLAAGLGLPETEAEQVLGWVLAWTGGHPYLTQRSCGVLAERQQATWTKGEVDRLIAETFFGSKSREDNNLQFVRDMLTRRAPDVEAVLTTYREVWRGRRVEDEEQSIVKSHLKLSGVVKRQDTTLIVRNPIYRRVFDQSWVQEHLPESWWERIKPAMPLIATMAVALLGMAGVTAYAVRQTRLAQQQTKVAQQQTEIALAQKLTAQAESLRSYQAALLPRSVLLAAESLELLIKNKAESGEADAALRTFSLMPLFVRSIPHDSYVRSAVFSPDGKTIVTASNDKTARIVDVATGKELHRISHDSYVNSAVFSPDGKTIVTASEDKTARIVDVATGKELHRISHEAPVRSAVFSPDGKTIVTASEDKTARIVDVATGKELHRISHEAAVLSAVFSPDGKTIVTASYDKTAQISLVNSADLIAAACRRLHRNLTRAEWRQYLGDRPYHQTCANLPPAPL